jgi:aryl-alcohol dehydrogenase-like predicted oxidoreductase
MGMSEFYGPRDDAESTRVLHRALDLGVSHWDSADVYGIGHNERLLAPVLRERRAEIFLATKFGNVRGEDGAFLGVSGKRDYVRAACEASLNRLGVEVIDLYYQHRVDPDTPIEETVGAMADLVREGKVRFLGLSEASAKNIRRAHAVHPIAALQTEYSLWSRDVEGDILNTCRELGIAFVAYSPLGRGFLTGTIKSPGDMADGDARKARFPRFEADNLARNAALLAAFEALAAEKGCTPSQLALAWVLAQGSDMFPIPGTKRMKYLEENAAADAIALDADDLARLDAMGLAVHTAGTRYSEPFMKRITEQD